MFNVWHINFIHFDFFLIFLQNSICFIQAAGAKFEIRNTISHLRCLHLLTQINYLELKTILRIQGAFNILVVRIPPLNLNQISCGRIGISLEVAPYSLLIYIRRNMFLTCQNSQESLAWVSIITMVLGYDYIWVWRSPSIECQMFWCQRFSIWWLCL